MSRLRILDSLDSIPASDWDDLHGRENPLVSHAFLSGLEHAGCLREDWGWKPHHLVMIDNGKLLAAAPGYIKTNSHGEFVFDHAWIQAYAYHRKSYFPKWLGAVPYSPVTGPRLLARDESAKRLLLETIADMTRMEGFSSAHINFHSENEETAFTPEWLLRLDLQYQWQNLSGWQSFDDFLSAMNHKYRKNIRQERAKIHRSGITYRIVHGDEASSNDLSAMYGFYLQTFSHYGNAPALTLEFFRHLAQKMPRNLVIILAEYRKKPIAGALCLRSSDTLYGRYWGCRVSIPGVHFETCYYQGIEYCLREGLTRFEPGAQGEHKIARGFLPVFVRSRHWIADLDFRDVLIRWCDEEMLSVQRYASVLNASSPFRALPE